MYLAEIKNTLGLLDVNSAPLSPIPSPVKKNPFFPSLEINIHEKAKECTDLDSLENSDPPALTSYSNSVIDNNSGLKASTVIDSVRNEADSSSDSAEELKEIASTSMKEKRLISVTSDEQGSLPGPSLCFKRRKLLKNTKNSIPSSLKLLSTKSKDVENDASGYNTQLGHSFNMKGRKGQEIRNKLKGANLIAEALSSLNCSTSGGAWTKQAVRALVNILINPKLIPDKTSLLLQVFCFLRSSYAGTSDLNSTNLYSLLDVERAIISSLYEVDSMKKHYLNDLLVNCVESMQSLIANKPDMRLKEICSLCKIYTEICKERNLAQRPVLLVMDFLKMRHKHSTFMIASIVGVWSSPFEMKETMSDEEKCLHSAISFGAFKKPKKQCPHFWNYCIEFLSNCISPAPDTEVVEEVLEFLFAKIHLECSNESLSDMEYSLLAPVVIFAGFSEWCWTKENILDKYVVPSLSKYGVEEPNEAAFEVFSYLYAEIFSYCPGKPADYVLENYFKEDAKGQSFLKDCAAVAFTRLLVLQKKAISKELLNWLQENIQNSKTKSLMRWIKIKKLTLISGLTKEDIII